MIRSLLCVVAACVGCGQSTPTHDGGERRPTDRGGPPLPSPADADAAADKAKEDSAKADMLALKTAYETFYTREFEWPKDQSDVYPFLEKGEQAFQSPWSGVMYQVHIQEIARKDGETVERPIVSCLPPGKPKIVVPNPTEFEKVREDRVQKEMLAIKKAYETFYTQNFRWPKDPSEVYPLLDKRMDAFRSPWLSVMYQVQIQETPQSDGSTVERVVVTCQPPGKPKIVVPDVTKDK
jgi:hypothetical protein